MAGIGFELRKLLGNASYLNIAKTYGYSGFLSSGAWIVTIIGVIGLNLLHNSKFLPVNSIAHFQISVTYLIALSLIFSSIAQHSFTRYVADRIFDERRDKILPNLNGILLLLIFGSGFFGLSLTLIFFSNESLYYQIFMLSSFVILCNIWLITNLLSGLKNYKLISLIFTLGYSSMIAISWIFIKYGINSLMFGFWIGQFIIMVCLIFSIYREYPSNRFIEFEFLKPNKMFISLVFSSFFYNLGIWIDKFIFWYAPDTSHQVAGVLHSSPIYDAPFFLALTTIIPGAAVFFFYMETDFFSYYRKYYNAIITKSTLTQIISYRYQLVDSAKNAILKVIKIQMLIIVIFFTLGDKILTWLHLSVYYTYLLNVDILGCSCLIVFLCLLNIIFYLDRRKTALMLSLIFLVSNFLFTIITLHLGIFYFGYGFALSLLMVCIVGAFKLNQAFNQLEYEAFTKYE